MTDSGRVTNYHYAASCGELTPKRLNSHKISGYHASENGVPTFRSSAQRYAHAVAVLSQSDIPTDSKTTVSFSFSRAGIAPARISPSSPAIFAADQEPSAIIAAYGCRGTSPPSSSSFHDTIRRERATVSRGS